MTAGPVSGSGGAAPSFRRPHDPRPGWRWLGAWMLRRLGWRVEGEVPDLPRMVVAVAPHTSNRDFVVMIAARFAFEVKVSFFGKHTLFGIPVFGRWLRWAGGIPVDRSAANGQVSAAVAALRDHERLWIGLAPEGTRRRVERFRTGFVAIAAQAEVPVLPVAIDNARRVIRIGAPTPVGPDVEAERARLETWFAPYQRPRHVR